jgi:hypothetical protein
MIETMAYTIETTIGNHPSDTRCYPIGSAPSYLPLLVEYNRSGHCPSFILDSEARNPSRPSNNSEQLKKNHAQIEHLVFCALIK